MAECEAVFPEQLSRAGIISGQGASFLAQDIGQARRRFQFGLERPGAGARVLAAQVRSLADLALTGSREAGHVAGCNQWLRMFNLVLLR